MKINLKLHSFKFLIFLLIFFCNFFVFTQIVSATCLANEICNPLGDIKTPQALITKIIEGVLGVVGSLALIMFVYGGFTWMMASGNQEAIRKGKDILIWATIGLVIIFSAYAILNTIFKGIGAFQ